VSIWIMKEEQTPGLRFVCGKLRLSIMETERLRDMLDPKAQGRHCTFQAGTSSWYDRRPNKKSHHQSREMGTSKGPQGCITSAARNLEPWQADMSSG